MSRVVSRLVVRFPWWATPLFHVVAFGVWLLAETGVEFSSESIGTIADCCARFVAARATVSLE